MASDKIQFLGINTDSPPDRLGDQLMIAENVIPRSPTSVEPRGGITYVGSISSTAITAAGVFKLFQMTTGVNNDKFLIVSGSRSNDDSYVRVDGVTLFTPRDTVWAAAVSTLTEITGITATTSWGKPNFVQFANKLFVFLPDCRPHVVMRGITSDALKSYWCGILPPLTAPTTGDHADDATNLEASDVLTIAYGFYSSIRNTFSRLSPTATKTLAATPKKVTLSGFETPRDGLTQDIDYIVIAVQSGTAQGLMAHTDYTYLYINPNGASNRFTTATFTFDVAPSTLEDGFDYSQADPYFDVPPTCKYADAYGNRLWMGGQIKEINTNVGSPTIDRGQSFRGATVTKITVASGNGWQDEHLGASVYYTKTSGGGSYYLGELWDYTSTTVAYLDRDIPAALETLVEAQAGKIYLIGYNDRVYPTSYHNYTMGGVPTVFPECVNMLDAQIIESVVDTAQTLQGIKKFRDYLGIVFDDSAVVMSGGKEVNTPLPTFNTDWGRSGCVSPRSICTDGDGNLAWISKEGVVIGDTSGVRNIAFEAGCNRLFRDATLISFLREDIPNLTVAMTWSREYNAFIFGPMTVSGTAGYWGMLSIRPQLGFWLFTGATTMCSNILEVANEYGGCDLYCGDYVATSVGGAYYGRLKKLLVRGTQTDIDAADLDNTGPTAYTWTIRQGYQSREDGQPANAARLRLNGVIAPAGTCTLTATLWRDNMPQRVAADIATADKIDLPSITETSLLRDLPLPTGAKRYFSIGLAGASNTGLTSTRLFEICRWQILFDEDGRRRA